MKIVLADFIFQKGHKSFNTQILLALIGIKDLDLYVVSNGNNFYNECLNDKDIKWINITKSEPKVMVNITSRIISLLNMIKISVKVKKISPDKVVVLGADIFALAMGRLLYRSDNLYVIQHQDTDELENSIKRRVFKTYMNKINHIVLADIIKEHLIKQIGVPNNRIYIINHPLSYRYNYLTTEDRVADKPIMVALSGSNDEGFIMDLLKKQRKNKILNKLNYKIIIKSKKYIYEEECLSVFNYYLSNEKYDKLIDSAAAIILPFPKTYKYRMSGALVDAVSCGKKVFARSTPIFEFYKKLYPDLIFTFESVEELISIINNNMYISNETMVEKFKYNHSQEITKLSLKKVMDSL